MIQIIFIFTFQFGALGNTMISWPHVIIMLNSNLVAYLVQTTKMALRLRSRDFFSTWLHVRYSGIKLIYRKHRLHAPSSPFTAAILDDAQNALIYALETDQASQ